MGSTAIFVNVPLITSWLIRYELCDVWEKNMKIRWHFYNFKQLLEKKNSKDDVLRNLAFTKLLEKKDPKDNVLRNLVPFVKF